MTGQQSTQSAVPPQIGTPPRSPVHEGRSVTRFELFLVATALALCGSYAPWVDEIPPSDVAEYRELAINLLRKGEYYQEPGYRAFRTPGLVLYLAAIYSVFGIGNDLAVRAIQVGLFAVASLLYYRTCRVLLSTAGAFTASLAFVFSHELIFWTAKPATEFLYTVWLLFALACMVRQVRHAQARWGLFSGLALGAAALTRPIAFAIAPLWAVFVLLSRSSPPRRRNLLSALAVLAGFGVVTVPWLVRNALLLGRPVIATSSGITLWWANHPGAEIGGWYGVVYPQPGPVVWLKEGKTELEINDLLTAEAWKFIRQDPVRFLMLGLGRIGYLLLGYRVQLTNVPYDTLLILGGLNVRLLQWNLAFLLLAIGGLVCVLRARDPAWLAPVAIIFGSLCVHFVYTAVPRMRVPLLPALFLLTVCGAQALWRTTVQRHSTVPPNSVEELGRTQEASDRVASSGATESRDEAHSYRNGE